MTDWSTPGMTRLATRVRERFGLTFPPGRRGEAEARIRRTLRRAKARGPDELLARMEVDPALWDDLLSELTVGESYFFRDTAQMELLRERVLPEIRRTRGSDHVLRIWSAGCAAGEEPYSLAIMLHTLGLEERAVVMATDVSRDAITRAREGRYRRWALRGVAPSTVAAYFHPEGELFALRESVKRRVHFSCESLAETPLPSLAHGLVELDLIVCRNVFIYFDAETTARVVRGFYAALAPGGWLVCGAADPAVGSYAPFDVEMSPAGLVYRRSLTRAVAAADRPSGAPVAATTGDDAPPSSRRQLPLDARDGALTDDDVVHSLRAMASSQGVESATAEAAAWLRERPHSARLHFVHAGLLFALDHLDEAWTAARRALFLAPDLVAAHVLAAHVALARDDAGGARRALRRARNAAAALPPGQEIPFGDGERAGGVVTMSARELARLGQDRAAPGEGDVA